MSKHLTPIIELPRYEEFEAENIVNGVSLSWDFDLPPTLDAERLVVDMARLRRAQRVGSIISSSVFSYQGDTTQVTHGINGIQADGTATASSSRAVTPAETSRTTLSTEFPCPVAHNFGYAATIHYLNKAEMVSSISDRKRGSNESRESIWADELNDAFVRSFQSSAKLNLTHATSGFRRMFDLANRGVVLPILASGSDFVLPLIGGLFLTIEGVIFYSDKKAMDGNLSYADRRKTLLIGTEHQTDRYIAFKALTAMAPIIRARK